MFGVKYELVAKWTKSILISLKHKYLNNVFLLSEL